MNKEIIIVVIVIIVVVGLDIITNKYTKKTLEILYSELNILKKYLLNESQEKAEKQIKRVKQKWRERYKVLAFYIEHDELEKVETEMVKLEANIEVEEVKDCISEIETIIFILAHIRDKEKIQIESIF